MRTTATCECGNEITAADPEALTSTFVEHCSQVHPEWEVSEQAARNYIEALDRVTGPTERLAEIGAIEVHTVTDANIDDVLRFFDHDAFADNPGWASCYCMFHLVASSTWGDRSARQNRDDLEAALKSDAITAIIASVEGRVAGWCNASLRRAYPAHRDGTADDDRTAAIVCFAVAPPYRGHGIARRLIDGAVEHLRGSGVAAIEAYPVRDPSAAAAAYHGTVGMFTAAGFDVRSDDDHGIVVRRALQ
jgi:GNAT superfamily N-acetyltransferase